MDKTKELETSFNHAISITERKSIIISGVKRIDSFDNEEFLMETTLGFLSMTRLLPVLKVSRNGDPIFL